MGVDILDLGSDRLSWRRLSVLIAHLPRESWTVREIAGEAARWGEQEHLLATLIDAQLYGNWLQMWAHAKKPPEPPPLMRRPGQPDPKNRIGGKQSYTPAEYDRIRASMKPKAVTPSQ